jgi:hypothetical protein
LSEIPTIGGFFGDPEPKFSAAYPSRSEGTGVLHQPINPYISMTKNPISKGIIAENFAGIGPVTHEMVRARARELALIAGRVPVEATPADIEQARRELTGGQDIDPQTENLESLPESKRWDPIPGSEGHQAPESPNEDEDDEGRSESAQLVEEGVNEAEHDQMLQAARAAEKQTRRDA